MAKKIGDTVIITDGDWEYQGTVVAVNSTEGTMKVPFPAKGIVIEQENSEQDSAEEVTT